MTSKEKDHGAPARARVGGAFDDVNDQFHTHYEHARDDPDQGPPVFVLLADELVVFARGQRRAYAVSPRSFHIIKSVVHAPVALFVALSADVAGPAPALARLEVLRAQIKGAVHDLRDAPGDASLEATARDLLRVLEACEALVARALAGQIERADCAAFANDLGPVLLKLAEDATRIQLHALHEAVEHAVSALSVAERAALHAVVAGDHQARARSLGMQYFAKRFGEGEGAEDRVTFAEGVSDEGEARALVRTQHLDRALARAFFGDEKRLQRDILGDAAQRLVQHFETKPIG